MKRGSQFEAPLITARRHSSSRICPAPNVRAQCQLKILTVPFAVTVVIALPVANVELTLMDLRFRPIRLHRKIRKSLSSLIFPLTLEACCCGGTWAWEALLNGRYKHER